MRPAVLITDGEQRAALATTRSLGKAGYAVDVCSLDGRSLAGASRYARVDSTVPDPLAEPASYVERIAQLCRRRGHAVLLPITEASLLAVLARRERLPGVVVPFPSLETFRAVSDKHALSETARRVGIAVPTHRVALTPGDVAGATGSLRYPVVLKPARSVGEADGQRAKLSVRYAADPETLAKEGNRLFPQGFPLLLQERIIGAGVGVFLLLWRGERIAVFSHRRIREKPPSGGVSVYCESVSPDPALVDASERLLRACRWEDGVAMVEYKVDEETGTPYLMEVNARFWGSLQLAVDAGVDFPLLLVEHALGRSRQRVEAYRVGRRNRWWWGDVDQLLARLRHSPDTLALPPGPNGKVNAVFDFLRPSWGNGRIETFALSDPGPFLRETSDWFRTALKQGS